MQICIKHEKNMNQLIEQLRELMTSLGETDYSLQTKTHISQSTIYRILEGKTSDPGVHKIDGIARAMGHRLSLSPMSGYSERLQNMDDVEALTKIIQMIEGLAQSRGFELSAKDKAQLIIENYQSKVTENQEQGAFLQLVNNK